MMLEIIIDENSKDQVSIQLLMKEQNVTKKTPKNPTAGQTGQTAC